MHNTQWWAK